MPIFIASLLGGLIQSLGSIVGRVLLALGIGYVTYSGISTALNWLWNLVQVNSSSGGQILVAALGLLQFDVCAGIIFGAVAVKLTVAGLSSDVVKRMVLK